MKWMAFILLLSACASRKEREFIPFERRQKEVTFDWNRDGKADRAALMEGTEDFLELGIWLSAVGGHKKVVANSSFIEAKSVPGARLEIDEQGIIKVIEDHSGVGAAETIHEWSVGYLDEKFKLVGYGYEFHDQLDNSKRGQCELDLVEGTGRVNGYFVQFDTAVKDINEITVNFQPKQCKFRFNRF